MLHETIESMLRNVVHPDDETHWNADGSPTNGSPNDDKRDFDTTPESILAHSTSQITWASIFWSIYCLANGGFSREPVRLTTPSVERVLSETCDLVQHVARFAPYQLLSGRGTLADCQFGLTWPYVSVRDGFLIHLVLALFQADILFLPSSYGRSYWNSTASATPEWFNRYVEAPTDLRCYIAQEFAQISSVRESHGDPGPIDIVARLPQDTADTALTFAMLLPNPDRPTTPAEEASLRGATALDIVSLCLRMMVRVAPESPQMSAIHQEVTIAEKDSTVHANDDLAEFNIQTPIQCRIRKPIVALLALKRELVRAERRISDYRRTIDICIARSSGIIRPIAHLAASYLLRPLAPLSSPALPVSTTL
jgi:hypothetical protein